MGLAAKKLCLSSEPFDAKKALTFNIFQVVAQIIAWGLIAPIFDIIIYAEPANKVFTQGLVAGLSNIVTTAVIGTLLCFAYSKARPAEGSLKKE
jgi:energy-coupling factor transport system substrate-specific component